MCTERLVSDPFLILINSPKQSMHVRNYFENKIFWKKPLKNQLHFFLCIQSLFIDKIIKNKRGLELVTSLSLGCKTCLENFFLLIHHTNTTHDIDASKGSLLFHPPAHPINIFNKMKSSTACNFSKKETHMCFPVKFAKLLRTPFLQNTSGRLLLYLPFKVLVLLMIWLKINISETKQNDL